MQILSMIKSDNISPYTENNSTSSLSLNPNLSLSNNNLYKNTPVPTLLGPNTLNQLQCWGDDEFSQTQVPFQVKSDSISVKAGEVHNCAVTAGGQLFCWGLTEFKLATTPRVLLDGIMTFSAGYAQNCAVRKMGEVLCWGKDGDGQCDVP